MEIRTINQIKIYYLVMNPMTDRTEASKIVVMSDDKQRLINYYTDNMVAPYIDGNWHKGFRKDSPLEWYNPIPLDGTLNHWGQGLKEEWVDEYEYLNGLKSKYFFI
jgi:hypothetical protein